MATKNKILFETKNLILIVFGCLVYALAYVLFLIPHQIVPGGISGVSLVINYFFHTPIGVVIVILNIPIFLVGAKVIGQLFMVKSIIGVLLSSFFIDFFTYAVPLSSITSNKILACLYGGITLGIGLGLIFRGGASTGGTDIIGQVINRYSNFSTGNSILIVDFCIISLSGIAFRNFELALYGYLTLFFSTKIIDLVLEGMSYTRAAFIVSDKTEEIAQAILTQIRRGVTKLHGVGAYSNTPRDVLYVVLAKRQVPELVNITKNIDPNAFVVITDVYEVLGKGFESRTTKLHI
ncbi:MAG: YitT family protein [candidate division WOR-3 bacterium]|nr:YitT family protein [candidate division WOR-3 bacterium]